MELASCSRKHKARKCRAIQVLIQRVDPAHRWNVQELPPNDGHIPLERTLWGDEANQESGDRRLIRLQIIEAVSQQRLGIGAGLGTLLVNGRCSSCSSPDPRTSPQCPSRATSSTLSSPSERATARAVRMKASASAELLPKQATSASSAG